MEMPTNGTGEVWVDVLLCEAVSRWNETQIFVLDEVFRRFDVVISAWKRSRGFTRACSASRKKLTVVIGIGVSERFAQQTLRKEIGLVQKQNDRRAAEVIRREDDVEQCQTLLHEVLKGQAMDEGDWSVLANLFGWIVDALIVFDERCQENDRSDVLKEQDV